MIGVASCGGSNTYDRATLPALDPPRVGWSYEVVASAHADVLTIAAAFAPGTDELLTVDTGGEPFVRDVEVLDGAHWRAITADGTSFHVRSCEHGCRVRYRFMLREATHTPVASALGDTIESLPSSWLLRPLRAPLGTLFRFHVTCANSEAFATGVFPEAGRLDTYSAVSGPHFQLPYSVFGALRSHDVDGAFVQTILLPGTLHHEADVVAWVDASSRAVGAFYGHFPVKHLLVVVRPTTGSNVDEGVTIGNGGAAIDIDVGEDATAASLSNDWVLVHEMVHTALPNLAARHRWLEEGLATYVEPLIRVRAGLKSEDALFHDWIVGMPNGNPEEGDRGLDRTDTWGRTYWGGALFCLLADVEIRARTHGARSLDDALRAIVAEGNISTAWTMAHVLDVGDAATGVTVLHELYARHAESAVSIDLDALWKGLGVQWSGHAMVYDDAAPLASVRTAMTMQRY